MTLHYLFWNRTFQEIYWPIHVGFFKSLVCSVGKTGIRRLAVKVPDVEIFQSWIFNGLEVMCSGPLTKAYRNQ